MSNLSLLSRILILISPFFVPWWIVLLLALASLFFFESYYEILVLGLICDVLYASSHTFFGLYGFTLISGLLLILVGQIKKRLIMY
jgi:hypothetical protein